MSRVEDVMNRIIIIIGNYDRFGGVLYETQFKYHIRLLAKELQVNEDEAIDYLYKSFHVNSHLDCQLE